MKVASLTPATSLDLELPWILTQVVADEATNIPKLGRRNLFLLACREVYRGGDIGPAENQLLQNLGTGLRLKPADAVKLASVARGEVLAGKVTPRRFDPERFFLKAVDLAATDGQIDPREQRFLTALASLLGFGTPKVQELLARLQKAHEASEDALPATPGVATVSRSQLIADAELFGAPEVEGGMSCDLGLPEDSIGDSGFTPLSELSKDLPPEVVEAASIEAGPSNPDATPETPAPEVEEEAEGATAEMSQSGGDRTHCWYKKGGKGSKWAKDQEKQRRREERQRRRTAAGQDAREWLVPAIMGGVGLALLLIAL